MLTASRVTINSRIPTIASLFSALLGLITNNFVLARQPGKDDLPKRPNSYGEVSNLQKSQGIAQGDMKKAKEAFAAFAKYNAEYISNPRVYSTPQEFRPDSGIYTVDQLITELNRHILVPIVGNQINPDSADYIRELGIALDSALKDVVDTANEQIIRINAARLLAAACRSGAAAHYPTVTKLLRSETTRPEVKYYLLQAAGNLLAAYDLNDPGYRTRRHSTDTNSVAELVAAIQSTIEKPTSLFPADGAGLALTEDQQREQLRVIGFIRKQAVRSLGRARFAEIKGTKGPAVYPAFTLARVAISDPAIIPPNTSDEQLRSSHSAEIAEAIIGICNLSPPRGQATSVYADAMADVVATGVAEFARLRSANATDKSQPWKSYAYRLGDALKWWQGLFDPNFNPLQPNSYSPDLVPKVISALVTEIDRRVLSAIDGTAVKVDIEALRKYRDDTLRPGGKFASSPFKDEPSLVLPKRP